MRKFLRMTALAALALGATAVSAHAQGAKQIGVVAGVDFANMSGTDVDGIGKGSRTGFIGGLYVAIPLADRMAIEPEVLYAMKGSKFNDVNIQLDHDYIQVPVLFKYNFNNDGGPYLLAGPAVNFSISCNEKQITGSASISCSDDGLDANTTFGGVVGLGFQKSRLGVEGRYDFDFGEAFKDLNAKNNAWEILARIMIK
jgi:hypothetical protein